MDYTADHPERRPDEIYIGNVSPDTIRTSTWQTKRSGTIALDNEGHAIVYNCTDEKILQYASKPMFIKRSEVETKLAAEKAKKDPFQPTIDCYERMLKGERMKAYE